MTGLVSLGSLSNVMRWDLEPFHLLVLKFHVSSYLHDNVKKLIRLGQDN